jgi:hypothetical protein
MPQVSEALPLQWSSRKGDNHFHRMTGGIESARRGRTVAGERRHVEIERDPAEWLN